MRILLATLLLALPACTAGWDTGFGDVCVFYTPGCSPGATPTPDPDTCYTSCDGEGAYCDAGTCTAAWIDPCAGGECAACGGEAWLCM